MLLIPSLLQKPGQGILLEAGHGAGVKAQPFPVPGQQLRRQDHIADANGRGDGLGKGVQIDDPLIFADGEQRGDRPPHKAELAVVVVLQNIPLRLLRRPAQQLLAAGYGHDDTRGIVMGRRDVYHVRRLAAQQRDVQPPVVQANPAQGHLVGLIDLGDLAVTRVLHGVPLVPAQQLDDEGV